MPLTKTDNLFLRAVKSHNSTGKLRQVYRRFYLAVRMSDAETDIHIDYVLAKIIDMSSITYETSEMLSDDFSPGTFIRNKIKFTKVDAFPGYITPRRWR